MPTSIERDVWIRAAEMALRVAITVAFFRGSRTVDVGDLKWAMDLVTWSTKSFYADLEENMSEDVGIGDLTKMLRKEFVSRKIMSKGEVHKFGERKTGERDYTKIDKVTDHLVTCQDIFPFFPPTGPGKPTIWWRWHSITEKEAREAWGRK